MSFLATRPPHRDALFSLVPANDGAEAALSLPANSPWRTTLRNGVAALTVGLISNVQNDRTLATLGRPGADIVLPGIESAVQCSFELHHDYNGYIMLHDRSRRKTTQVSGYDVHPYEPSWPRQIVLQQGESMVLQMGRRTDLFVFKVELHADVEEIAARLEDLGLQQDRATARFQADPCEPFSDTIMPTPERHARIRYSIIEVVGDGAFGQVMKCVNVDSGSIIAVKTSLAGYFHRSYLRFLHREIETLGAVSHENIVEFLGSQEGEAGSLEIFMAVKDGSVEDLVECRPRPQNLAKNIIVQILRALAYLDSQSLIHRDVKPANILYSEREDGGFQFYLADFGLSNWVDNSNAYCGTPLFRAPEIWKHEEQSTKVDVWSLFVTFLWLANTRGFRTTSGHLGVGRHLWLKVQSVGYLAGISKAVSALRNMGAEYPEQRPSAREALNLLGEAE